MDLFSFRQSGNKFDGVRLYPVCCSYLMEDVQSQFHGKCAALINHSLYIGGLMPSIDQLLPSCRFFVLRSQCFSKYSKTNTERLHTRTKLNDSDRHKKYPLTRRTYTVQQRSPSTSVLEENTKNCKLHEEMISDSQV